MELSFVIISISADVIISSSSISTDVEALQQVACMGIYNTLRKPFDLETLLALVTQVMCCSKEEPIFQSA